MTTYRSSESSRVNIGVPVYNGARFLRATLESLLAQTYRDFELIISDNASTDDTAAICSEFALSDPRIRYYRHAENRGAAWNFNEVFRLSRGEYFKWAMADDIARPEILERCLEALQRCPEAVLASVRTVFIDENDAVIKTLDPGWDLQDESVRGRLAHVISHGGHWANADALAGVIRRSALLETRLLPDYQGGDKRLIAELAMQGLFCEIPEYLYLRRTHPRSSASNNPGFASDKERAIVWMSEFYKTSRSRVARPTWHLYGDYVGLIGGSDLPSADKLRLLGVVARMSRRHWRRLFEELRL